ncbi:hypothetical protein Niako_5148 [Niastella koreensis GR20-10]|uniref:Uncharacterized protein n=1 Tax=Niastella koreensis (strain DSM 17620 / KACC 11465 / NBRC 106392 / GR20-10) TaxID=700598 RepID=G8TB40_NIAKG|nr:hypothetical protein Niako_5148 [Niastella koreensis GR20-10]
MRYIYLILSLIFISSWSYSQRTRCTFPYTSIIIPDSIYSCQLLDTMRSIPFKDYNRRGKIPRFIKRALNCWTDCRFSIANRGRPANIGCSVSLFSFLIPDRELLYLGLSKNYLLLSYERGNYAVNSPVVLIRFEKRKIISVWFWQWFATNIKTREDLFQYLEFYTRVREDHPVF